MLKQKNRNQEFLEVKNRGVEMSNSVEELKDTAKEITQKIEQKGKIENKTPKNELFISLKGLK